MVDLEATLRSSLDGRYVIEGELGTGAMAVVFLAHDLKHDRRVAIKVLKPELASAIGGDRFQREIEVVAGLTHPHILPLYDSGEADGLLYYVMPHIEGESLRARLKREGRLPVRDAIRITREIADALGFAHRHGVIHRDVKPGNILLTEDHARLADFGIAYLAETEGGTLTGTGLALGTPAYFSPEQATGDRDLDGRSDIYSLGCVLYEALTGQPPFTATSVRALITHHLVDAPPQVRELRPEVSEGTEAVVQTALQKEPENRFQTAEEMAGSLDLISGGFEAIAAAALRKLIGPRHRWLHGKRLAVLVAAAVLTLVAGGLLLRTVLQRAAFTGADPIYAVLPFEGGGMSEEEVVMSRQAARELSWHLMDWQSITVVGGPGLEGPSNRVVQAGFGVPTISLTAGLELLETLNASHLIYVDANVSGDSVELAASIFRRGQRRAERQLQGLGPKSEIELITAGLALGILEINGEPAQLGDLVSRSPNHVAHQQFNEGRAALWDWRLAEAEKYLRAAIAEDSAFALSHYLLATTMYWRTVQDPERILDGPTIAYHARQADRLGTKARLRPGERSHVDAFVSFWTGDYETARARYDSILERQPMDLEALVLAGAVEFTDPWLVEGREGTLLPRQDLNRARSVFDSAVSLSSHVQLAWGSLFDIDRKVAESAYEGVCFGFQPPGAPLFPPYEFPEAADQLTFCPYVADAVIRWRPDTLLAEHRAQALAGVRELQARTIDRLKWWTRVEKDQPRPHEELADWMLWERSLPGCEADPEWADSLVQHARIHYETALAIRGDTTPEDRVRFAALLLATDNLPAAVDQTDRVLDELGDWRSGTGPAPRLEAANIYMAAGRGREAAEILERVGNESTFAVPDPESDGDFMAGGNVWGTLWALGALGVTASDDADMARRFALMQRTWSQPEYTARQRARLHFDVTGLVSPALVRLPVLWNGWFEGWEEYGLEVPTVWRGLRLADTDPGVARQHLDVVVGDLVPGEDRPLKAYYFYMPIALAERLGEDAIAADLKGQARACPLGVNRVDLGWGMKRYLAVEPRD